MPYITNPGILGFRGLFLRIGQKWPINCYMIDLGIFPL